MAKRAAPVKRVSKAIAAGVGGGAGLGLAALALPPDAPAWLHALVIIAVAFITTYWAPRNADDDDAA